ncbi:RNA-directed DNA polymerase, eukaryota [Tanacetum coccineum]
MNGNDLIPESGHNTINGESSQSKDPFNLYELLQKKKVIIEQSEDSGPSRPPGFTPNIDELNSVKDNSFDKVKSIPTKNRSKCHNGVSSSQRSTSMLISGGSILEVMDDLVKVGQTMRYDIGGCNKAKNGWINRLCLLHKLNFIALQETKMESIDTISIKSIWGNYSFDHVVSSSVGNSGGILCIWDPSMFTKDHVSALDYFLAIMGTWAPSSTKLLVILVYAPRELSEKRELWSYLSIMIDRWKGEVIILGDFNEVRTEHEKFGSSFNVHGANFFNNFISTTGLIDLPLGGYSYTWSHKSASKMSKLDRFLISKGLLMLFPHLSGLCLDRHLSDHRPIIMYEPVLDYGPTPFRIFHFWFKLEGFDKVVEDTWNSTVIEDTNDQGEGNEEILNQWALLMKDLTDIHSIKASELSQKAKVRWSIEGDKNSKYFHGIINSKISQLNIRGILQDGDWVVEPNLVKLEFLKHFSNQFSKPLNTGVKIDFQFPIRLRFEQIEELECSISYEEIKKAVWDCGFNKSPGPDGKFPQGCNSSFTALIPKIHDAKDVKDFRPISLIGSLYKIIAKILANRLTLVISDLVSDVQSAFITNRQILDGPFILNELISWCKHKKINAMIFKVDFKKLLIPLNGII